MPGFRFLSSASALASHYSASVLPFSHFLAAFASQLAISVLLFRLRFPGFSPSFQPGFPCLLSGSVFMAFCSFPFILPCFAPTAVPQVLTFFSLSTSLRCFALPPLSFVHFGLGSDYSASVSSVPFFPAFPHSGSFRCLFIRIHFSLFPCFRFCFGTWLPAIPFSAGCFASQVLLQLPTSCFQLGRSP